MVGPQGRYALDVSVRLRVIDPLQWSVAFVYRNVLYPVLVPLSPEGILYETGQTLLNNEWVWVQSLDAERMST